MVVSFWELWPSGWTTRGLVGLARVVALPFSPRLPRRAVDIVPPPFAAADGAAIDSLYGTSSAAFSLDGSKGRYDQHCGWRHCSGLRSQGPRGQGILSLQNIAARPRRRRFLQSLLPGLPVHIPFSRAPLQTLRRR